MNTVPNAALVDAAVEALSAFNPEMPEQAVNMLALWSRRPELTDLDLSEVVNRLFPDSMLVDPPACPAWCSGAHYGETVVPEIRECTSEEVYVPDLGNSAVPVDVARIFDRITGRFSRPAHVRIGEIELTSLAARAMARELNRAAALLEDGVL
ncbi:hypothetical protein [Actinoplanes sichuanensis]|uniref:Uncharacterized protein n=1 Tax=Actinoplanes sichuanensis TaxID=512349 RepID=A0ABW4A8D8_9ACTN|nr:hypothetical protein [Actinoplanes sichuanensis]